jgi:hypothetical protein
MLKYDGGSLSGIDDPAHDDPRVSAGQRTKKHKLPPGKTANVIVRHYEVHRRNSAMEIQYIHPLIDPEVRVEKPDDLEFSLEFGVPDAEPLISPIDATRRLEGTQFPGQRLRVRWWPKRIEERPSGHIW